MGQWGQVRIVEITLIFDPAAWDDVEVYVWDFLAAVFAWGKGLVGKYWEEWGKKNHCFVRYCNESRLVLCPRSMNALLCEQSRGGGARPGMDG
jgi:hypothetical protein